MIQRITLRAIKTCPLVLVGLLAWPLLAVAQSFTDSFAVDAPECELCEQARELLSQLVGTWHIDSYGRTKDEPVSSGVRTFEFLYDSLRVRWNEVIGDSARVGTGLLGFDSIAGGFYYLGVYEEAPGPIFLLGTLNEGGAGITFDPISLPSARTSGNQGLVRSILRVVGEGRLIWSRYDEGWQVVFTLVDDRQ